MNFWMRLLPVSATKTCPLPSVATPTGVLNCPLPEPELPHVVRKLQGGPVVEVVLDVEVVVLVEEVVELVEDVLVVGG